MLWGVYSAIYELLVHRCGKVCWNKERLCWKIAKLFYFCHLKKSVRPETFGPYYVHTRTVYGIPNFVTDYMITPFVLSDVCNSNRDLAEVLQNWLWSSVTTLHILHRQSATQNTSQRFTCGKEKGPQKGKKINSSVCVSQITFMLSQHCVSSLHVHPPCASLARDA